MKNNHYAGFSSSENSPTNLFSKIMKITIFLFCFCAFNAIAGNVNSQNAKVSIKKANVPLEEILSEIENQTNYLFMYSDAINTKQRTSIKASNKSVAEVLKELFEGKVAYEMEGNHIILSSRTKENGSVQQEKNGIVVTGQVVDELGIPIIGATISEKGVPANGVITDIDGNFSIRVSKGAILQISYIGYKNQEVNIGTKTAINVVLKENSEMLEEVVVVGYGTQKKVNLTGAVETVKSERIADKPVTSLATALTGEAAGVTVTQSSGQPGPNQGTIRVRGIGTWGDASPLVLVDGVSMSMNDVIPSEVESVSILKDAASAAIYGSRAANGVILVTTKKGKEGKMRFNYTGSVGIQTPTRVPEMADSWQYAELYNQMLVNDGKSPLYTQEQINRLKAGGDPDKNEANTDWFDEVLNKAALQHSHQIGMNGGNDRMTYMVSAGYTDQQGVIPSASYERYNLRINTSSKLTDWLKMDVNMAYLNSMKKESTGGAAEAYRRAMRALPYMPVRYSDGTWSYSTAAENPVRRTEVDDYGLNSTHNDVMTLLISPEIKVMDGLTLKGTFGYESNIYKNKIFEKTVEFGAYEPTGQVAFVSVPRNKQSDNWSQYRNLTANATANYSKTFGKHDIAAMAGWSLETFKFSSTSASRMDFPNNDFTEIGAGDATTAAADGNSTYSALVSGFGRVNYTYANRYLVEFTARYDGSSKFARGHRFGFFPSVSAGWRISEEAFFEPLRKQVSNFKLRASWGKLGNQNISNYQFLSTIGTDGNYLFGTTPIVGYGEKVMGNELITWETSTNLDFGFDMGLFDNRLNVTFDWYKRSISDILLSLAAPSTLGIDPAMTNAGEMENKGWELTLNWRSKIGKDFNYSIGFNLSDVKNKVTDLHGYKSPSNDLTVRFEGEPLNAIYGWETLGICEDQATYEKYAELMKTYNPGWGIGDIIIKDLDNNNKIDSNDKKVIGNSIPRFTYGLNLGFEYKNFDFSAFFQGVGKADGYVTNDALQPMGVNSARKDHYTDSFDPANPKKGCYYPRIQNKDYNYSYMSHWVQNAAYLRMKNLTFGYTFKMTGVGSLRLYASGENLFTLTKFRTWDPETSVGARGFFPNVSVYSLGVNLNF